MGRQAIAEAAVTLLDAIDGVGMVTYTRGLNPEFNSRNEGNRSFWEVRVSGAEITQFAADRHVERPFTVFVEGWLPVKSNDNPSTINEWFTVVDAVELVLLNNHRTLSDTWTEGEPPETLDDDEVEKADAPWSGLCHHVRIQVRGHVELQYEEE